jgi:hypothetical protein
MKLKITMAYAQPSGQIVTETVTTNLGTVCAWETAHGTSSKNLVTRERLDDYGWLFWYKLTKLGKENRTWAEFEDALDELIEVQPIQVNPTEAAVTGAS